MFLVSMVPCALNDVDTKIEGGIQHNLQDWLLIVHVVIKNLYLQSGCITHQCIDWPLILTLHVHVYSFTCSKK